MMGESPSPLLRHLFIGGFIIAFLLALIPSGISSTIILELLQFVALALPAAAIYLQVFSRDLVEDGGSDAGPQIHQIRLVFIFLGLSGMMLLVALFIYEHEQFVDQFKIVLFQVSLDYAFQVSLDFVVILSMISISGALGMFVLSMAYWTRALNTESSIWSGFQQPFQQWMNVEHEENIDKTLQILGDEGPQTVEEINEKTDFYRFGQDYIRQLKDWGQQFGLMTETANGKLKITEVGEKRLSGEISWEDIRDDE